MKGSTDKHSGKKILILGAGAVGLCIAARLSKVCSVHAVCRKRIADAVTDRGFSMTGIWGTEVYRFSASEDVPAGTRYDYIFITSKSQETENICRQFEKTIRDNETVSLQNGIGNEEIISRFTNRVIGGMIITGFEWRGDAAVQVSVEAGPIKLGRFPEGSDVQVEDLVALLKSAGMNVEGSRSICSDLWSKTIYNCALNPLGAVMGVPYGKLVDPASWHIIENIVQEAFFVVAAEGVDLPWNSAGEYLAYLREVQIPATSLHHSSMLQDISRGRKTEIDFINGAVITKGLMHGIPTPYNSCIADLIHFRQGLVERRDTS
jgi:2-dehydropantoate 2-reductase